MQLQIKKNLLGSIQFFQIDGNKIKKVPYNELPKSILSNQKYHFTKNIFGYVSLVTKDKNTKNKKFEYLKSFNNFNAQVYHKIETDCFDYGIKNDDTPHIKIEYLTNHFFDSIKDSTKPPYNVQVDKNKVLITLLDYRYYRTISDIKRKEYYDFCTQTIHNFLDGFIKLFNDNNYACSFEYDKDKMTYNKLSNILKTNNTEPFVEITLNKV